MVRQLDIQTELSPARDALFLRPSVRARKWKCGKVIAEPILKKNIERYKWNFIFYDTFISFYEKSRQRKTVEPSEIDRLANLSTRSRYEQQTLGQFTNRSELEKED